MYKEIQIKTALNKINNSYLPYKWDLNIYRGCIHKCAYCYALYSHKYLNSKNFFNDIFVKKNIASELDKKLASKFWKRELINIGGVTDSYQEIEKKQKIMPEILKIMIKHKNPITISTKSDLILRDYNLIEELSKLSTVYIALSITSTNLDIQKLIEPHASQTIDRFNVIKELSKTNAIIGVHNMPILPFITDSCENLESIFAKASEYKANYIFSAILNLRGETKKHFLSFIKTNFAHLYPLYLDLYIGSFVNKEYSQNIYKQLKKLRTKYKFINNKLNVKNDQLDLDF